MTQLKNALFDSDLLQDNHFLPLDEFEKIRLYETYGTLDCVKEPLLREIITSEGNVVDLRVFMDILDLFTLLPITKKVD